jgi:excisionase family DNA binding protein
MSQQSEGTGPGRERMLRVRQVKERYGYRTAAPVYQMIRDGRLPAVRIGKFLLVPESAVEASLRVT